MSNQDPASLIKKVIKMVTPSPTWAEVYAVISDHPEIRDPSKIARLLSIESSNHQFISPGEITTLKAQQLQKELRRYLVNPPSYQVIKQTVKAHPESLQSLRDLAKIIARKHPKYPLRDQPLKKSSLDKSKSPRKKRKKRAAQTSGNRKPLATIYGQPGNYWVLAWRGWSRSRVVNPRYLNSGIPKKYKTWSEAVDDCQKSDCKLLPQDEYFEQAPAVAKDILWALEKKNQRRKGASLSKDNRLIKQVASMFPKQYRGDFKLARIYLKDIENIFPQARELENVVIIKAVQLTRRGGLTARKTAKKLRKLKYGYKDQPEKVRIVYTAM